MRTTPALAALLALVSPIVLPAVAHAAPGAGTLADPIVVDALPYAARGTTVGAPSAIDSYACAPTLDESGGEVVYAFTLAAPARVTAWVEGDGGAVDIDVHLLDTGALSGATASGCVARGNVIAEAELGAGTHYVVVDSYDGAAQSGPYVLRLSAIGDAWVERPLAEGVIWRARRFADLAGGPQVVHELVIDPLAPGVRIEAVMSSGCQTVGAMGAARGALAAINGGYFNVSTCAPVSLLKSKGTLLAENGATRGAFGLSPAKAPMIAIVDAGADWPAAEEAHGGGPVLVEAQVAHAGSAEWAAQGFSSASFNGKNPRTFAAHDASGRVLFGTVDGRRSTAAGMSLDALAAFSVSAEIGATEAVNLDGGGSTTLWIAGATPNGVVNYPSDDPDQELATHPGSRGVSGGFFVFAAPFNHPPRFQTSPVTMAAVGTPYTYDVDAIDLDVDDSVTFTLLAGPPGMAIDAVSGVIELAPVVESPPEVTVTVRAADDRGAMTDQTYTLLIAGALGPPDAGAGGAANGGMGGASTGGEGGASTGGGEGGGGPSETGGCGCRVAGGPGHASGFVLIGLLAVGAIRGRRRRHTMRGYVNLDVR